MEKMLLHCCCGPCAIFPLGELISSGEWKIRGLWYNPNVHPFTEYAKRRDTLLSYFDSTGTGCIVDDTYDVVPWLRRAAFRETEKCRFCYHDRLGKAAMIAKKGKFAAFTTTLLYSKFQSHELIRQAGEAAAAETGVRFHYVDFRKGWKEGMEKSRTLSMYRQRYCGCIYSEEPGNKSQFDQNRFRSLK